MKTSITEKHKKKSILLKLGIFVFWVGVWQILCNIIGKELLLPSPWKVATRFLELCSSSSFWKILAVSCSRVLLGLLLGFLVGGIMGVLCAKFSLLYDFFRPLLRIITTTPVASFIILAYLWMRAGKLPVFITFLMVVPLVWNNLYQGFQNVDKSLLEMSKFFQLSPKQIWSALYVPTLKPYFFSSIQTGMGFAWKAGIAAEIIVQPAFSIGKEIYGAKIYFETVDLFAWTLTVILLSLLFEKLSFLLLRYLQGGDPVASRKSSI